MATINIDTYILKGTKWVIEKDSNAKLDYAFDWTRYLAALSDTIVDAVFLIDETLVEEQVAFDTLTATIWLSAGVVPTAPVPNLLRVTSRITTAGGRVDDRSIYLKIVEK